MSYIQEIEKGSASRVQKMVQEALDKKAQESVSASKKGILEDRLRRSRLEESVEINEDVEAEQDEEDFDLDSISDEDLVPTDNDYSDNSEAMELDWSEIDIDSLLDER